MVSIISEEILNQTVTVSVTDNAYVGNFDMPVINVPNFDGFAYTEIVITEVDIQSPIDIAEPGSGDDVTIRARLGNIGFPPATIFSSGSQSTIFFGNISGNQTLSPSQLPPTKVQANSDIYVDNGITFTNFLEGSTESVRYNGDQNLDVNVKLSIFGRRP
jgi:hypothetical protein